MISAKITLVFGATYAFLTYILIQSKVEDIQSFSSVSICSSKLKKSAIESNKILEEYERFLAVMFRNTSNIGRVISATSTFQESPNYFASSAILDTADFFVKTIPYLAHQYDEQDLILYADYPEMEENLRLFRNVLLIHGALCHKILFKKRFSGEMVLVINLELYDKIDDDNEESWLEFPFASSPKREYLIPGMHLTMKQKSMKRTPIDMTSLLVLKIQGSSLQNYFHHVCDNQIKKQLLHHRYPNICKIPTHSSEYFKLTDEYIQDNIVIISLLHGSQS